MGQEGAGASQLVGDTIRCLRRLGECSTIPAFAFTVDPEHVPDGFGDARDRRLVAADADRGWTPRQFGSEVDAQCCRPFEHDALVSAGIDCDGIEVAFRQYIPAPLAQTARQSSGGPRHP